MKGRENWSVEGIVCYSKICTHVGCPISLNERTTHHMLCPCHQSTFDLADSAKVIFGPAARPLPQLPIMVDDEGYLVAQSDFTEPVGPSFWEREREMSIDTSKIASTNATTPAAASKPSIVGAAAELGRRPARPGHRHEEAGAQGLPGPLVVHAGRDRPVELHRPAADRRLPDLVVRPEHGRNDVRGLLRPAARHPHVRGLRLHHEHLLRRPRRPADAPDAPLGRDDLRGRR